MQTHILYVLKLKKKTFYISLSFRLSLCLNVRPKAQELLNKFAEQPKFCGFIYYIKHNFLVSNFQIQILTIKLAKQSNWWVSLIYNTSHNFLVLNFKVKSYTTFIFFFNKIYQNVF